MRLRVLALGGVLLSLAAAACSDITTGPPARPPTHAPAASAITVPANSSCKLDLARAVRRSFWPESRLDPSDALTMALEQMDSIEATTTSEVDPFLNEEEPFTEDELPAPPLNEGYYDPVTGDPCWDMYMGCIESCKKWKTKTQRQMCYALCMTYYADCRAEQYLPPSLRGCWDVRSVSYSPYGDYCSGSGGSWGDGTSGGCAQVYVRIEVNNGAGWETWWEGWATVCD